MKILLVTCRFPWPARRGDQMRALQFVEALRGSHEVRLLVPEPDAASAAAAPADLEVETYAPGSAWSGVLGSAVRGGPLQSGLFASRDLERKVASLSADSDLVVLQLARLAGLLEHVRAPAYVDLIDALSLNMTTRAAVDRAWWRPLLREEARRLRRQEARVLRLAAGCCVVCERDRDALATAADGAGPDVVRLPMVAGERRVDPAEPVEIALTGNLGYFVNRDAARWFLGRVWPRLRGRLPEARLVLAGDRVPSDVARMARRTGARLVPSPDRLLDVIESARVCVAPMRCGSGVPVKVLEAWACGTPVVASPYAAQGVAGRHERDLLIAERPDEWVRAIVGCLDGDLSERLVAGGRRHLESEHSPESIGAALRGRLERLVDAASMPPR